MSVPPNYPDPHAGASAGGVTTISLQPGDRVGAYTIREPVGRGGSGAVFRAHDALLDRYVAIKHVILGDAVDAGRLRDQIRREAALQKKAATARPKHLVQFIDTIDDPRGLMLVTEFIDGVTLEERLRLRTDPHDERGALGILAAGATALQDLHDQNIIHRDLKPANVMLPKHGGLKLADFGLAALIGDQESLSLGTVRYMAPELLRGDPATPASDLYSLGMIAYELLAGRDHFDEAFKTVLRDKRNPAMRWMKWHTNERLTAPPLTELVPKTPQNLSDLVARMLDKDPARRVRHAGEVIDAIRRHFIEGSPDTEPYANATADAALPGVDSYADPAGGTADPYVGAGPDDTARLPTRSKLPLLLGGLLAFWVLVGGVVYFVNSAQRQAEERREASEAVQAFNDAKQELLAGNYGAAIAGFDAVIEGYPGQANTTRAAGVWSAFGEARRAEADGDFEAALAGYEAFDADPQGDRALVRPLIESVQRKAGFDVALTAIRAAIDSAEFDEARRSVAVWRAENLTASESQRLDELEAGITAAESEARFALLLREAQAFADQGDLDRAIELLGARPSLPPDGVRMLANFRSDLALAAALRDAEEARSKGLLAEAIAAYRRALELEANPLVSAELNRLEARLAVRQGAELRDAGQLEQAAALFEAALHKDPGNADAQRFRRELVSVSELQSLIRAGDDAMDASDFEAAETQYRKAFELDPLDVVRFKLDEAQRRLAMAAAEDALTQGRFDDADRQAERAAVFGPDHTELIQLRQRIATRRQYQAKLDAAEAQRAQGNLQMTIRRLQDAKEILATPEVNQRIRATQYAWSISKARQHLADGLLGPARAELEIAGRIDFTDEVQELFDRLEAEQSTPTPTPE
ncbi:MAG: protein kinase [Planctomycetota bacterium]